MIYTHTLFPKHAIKIENYNLNVSHDIFHLAFVKFGLYSIEFKEHEFVMTKHSLICPPV